MGVATKSKKKKHAATKTGVVKKKVSKAVTQSELDEVSLTVERAVLVRRRAVQTGATEVVGEVDAALSSMGVEATESGWRWIEAPQLKLSGKVVAKVLAPGSGKKAVAGSRVKVKYVGALFESGKKFDAGTVVFDIDDGDVIQGWDVGVCGMRTGEKRRLKIPPEMAYGAEGAPPRIPPFSTLLFDVILKKILSSPGSETPPQQQKKKKKKKAAK